MKYQICKTFRCLTKFTCRHSASVWTLAGYMDVRMKQKQSSPHWESDGLSPAHQKKKKKRRRKEKKQYIQPAGASIFLLCHVSLSISLSLEKNEMSGETISSHQPLWKSRHFKWFHWLGAFVYFCQIYRLYKMVFWAWYEALEACAQMEHLLLVERASYSLRFYHCSWAENQWA